MTTGTKIALVVGGLALVGGGIAFAMMRKKPQVGGTRPQPQPESEPQSVEEEVKKKKKKGALLPVLGGLFVAGGTYLALKKKDKKADPFTTIQDNEYGYTS